MNDRQPLLNVSSQFSIGDDDGDNRNKKQFWKNNFSDWRRFFSRKKNDNKYIPLDEDIEHNDNDAAVGIFHLFRFANRVDFVLMFTAMFLMLVRTVCILVAQILVGRLTGIFAIKSFGDNCDDLQQNFTTSINNNDTYFHDIDFNISNNGLPHKQRYNSPLILSSTLLTSSSSFRDEVMHIIRWLFIAGIIEYLADFIKNFIWSISVKRQIYRMSVALFRSLVQRSFAKAQGAAAEVFRLIDEGNDTSINEADVWKDDTESIYNINGDIEFDNVDFIYPSRKEASVLRNLSLVARAGETTALVGSSGSGKSTCMSLFLRYFEPSSGRITIDGRPITDYNVKQLRENIGVVSQEPVLFDMSIYENIRFGKVNATKEEIEQAAREANAHHFIMQLPDKYATLVGERGVQLSGGEKQRIALARALVKQPTFLLLDEATSALDNVSEKIVQEALDRACNGRTTLVIAHRLTTIQNAHQIYVLDKGSVIEQGTHETLMEIGGGKYQAMVTCQQMEGIYDNQDDRISIQKTTEEDEKSMFERSRLISDIRTIHVNKQIKKSSKQRFVFLRLLSMNSPEWITISIGCIACVLNGAAQPLFAFFLVKIVEAFKYCSASERHLHVLLASFLFLLLGGILFVLRFFQYTAFAISGSKLTQRIRSKTFSCLLRQEVAYFDRPENSSDAICTRLSSDAPAIQEMTGTRLGLAVEVISNMRTIKQLSIEKEVLRQYSELAHQLFMAFAIAAFTIQALKVLGMISDHIATSVSAAEAFFDLFDREPAIDNTSTEGLEIADFHGKIEFDQVRFIYPSRPRSLILNRFQLNITPSQHVALVGRSGCGKSTIIQLLERFYDVTSGRILLDGIDIRTLNIQSVRSHIGLVSQEPILFDLTIAENIAYGLENIPMEDIINAAIKANVHQFIEQLPQQIKKSSKQRFVFLRLLSMNSPEWITISIGCIACVLNGAAQPLFAFFLVKIVEALKYCSATERRHHILLASFLFLLLGGILFVFRFFQYTAFAIAGSKLTQRIRSKTFSCLLRQEVAYFDRPENSSGAICTRLSSDASAIQEMTGTRLGVICEILSLSVFAFAVFTIQALKVLGMISGRIAASISAAEAFFDLFDREPAIDNTSTEGLEIADFRGEIKFDQVRFIYPSRPTSLILNRFQLSITPSQHVALVGGSGCGKSTIIQLLERFYDVTSGRILLDGIDIQKLNIQWVRSHIGLVSQEPILFDLTIAENIAYGLENIPMEDIINAAI
ncbi:unnamed protein product, partial [Rotaria sp. Silwood1]